MEYIHFHRYVRNTPSDRKVHAEHQLRADRRTLPEEKNIQNQAKLSRMKELGGKTGVLVGLDLPSVGWGTEAGSNTHIGQLSESEEKHLRLTVKQPICGSLNGMRIRQALPQPYIPRTRMRSPGRQSGWELEFGDCGVIQG